MCIFSVYNKFKIKNWERFSSQKRKRILQKVEKKQANKLGIDFLPIVIYPDDNWQCLGMYEVKNGKTVLYLHKKLLFDTQLRFHALETIIHETRHAYQYAIISRNRIHWWQFKLKKWKRNYESYISSANDNEFYNLQPIERDAQKYAINNMLKLKRKFKRETDFKLTLEHIISRYENSEQNAKEKHGFWYKLKLRKKIKEKVHQ